MFISRERTMTLPMASMWRGLRPPTIPGSETWPLSLPAWLAWGGLAAEAAPGLLPSAVGVGPAGHARRLDVLNVQFASVNVVVFLVDDHFALILEGGQSLDRVVIQVAARRVELLGVGGERHRALGAPGVDRFDLRSVPAHL